MIIRLTKSEAGLMLLGALVRSKRVPAGVDCFVDFRQPPPFEVVICFGDDLPPERAKGVAYLSDYRGRSRS